MDYLENFKSRFEHYYKKTREVPKTRECIVENLLTNRRTTRAQVLTERRNIEVLSPSPVLMVSATKKQKSPTKKMDRLARLKLWKEEKLKKMEQQKSKMKPLFKVGAKANVGFPNVNETKQIVKKSFAPKNCAFKAPSNVKAIELIVVKKTLDTFRRVTRSQKNIVSSPVLLPKKQPQAMKENKKKEPKEKKIRNKLTRQNAIENVLPEINVDNTKKSTKEKKVKKNSDDTKKESSNKRQSKRKSFRRSISNTEKTTDLNGTYELINPENQTTPLKDDVFSPAGAYISPFVTTSRGKGSIKKENKERTIRGLPSFTEYNTPDEEANSSFQITGASYFHTILNNEISRLTSMCKTWDTYKANTSNLPEDAQDLIDVAVGQANLLMNKKFQQFKKLIISCENGYGEEKPVTCEDLQGFWDMIYIQVENLNTRFNRLTELKNKNWEEIIPVVQQQIVKKKANKKRIKSAATSNIRAAIEAARKKTKSTSSIEDTVFNGGFFVVKSPQKTPEKIRTPAKDRRNLLKSVLSSETRKSSRNRKSVGSPGINMMKASQTAKSIENLNFTLPTPGKSILKKITKRKSIMNTSKAVLFKDYDSDNDY